MANRWKRLFLLPMLTGLLGGAAAAAMEWGLHFGTEALIGRAIPADPLATLQFHWAILIFPAGRWASVGSIRAVALSRHQTARNRHGHSRVSSRQRRLAVAGCR